MATAANQFQVLGEEHDDSPFQVLGEESAKAPAAVAAQSATPRVDQSKLQTAPEYGSDEWYASKIPNSAWPAVEAVNKYAVEPLNRMAQTGGEGLKQAVRQDVLGSAESLAHLDETKDMTPEQTAQRFEQRNPVTAGAVEGAATVAGSTIADPRNWPFFVSGAARPLLQRVMSVGFTGALGKGAVDAAKQLHDNWDQLTPAQRSELATQGGISALMAAGGAVKAINPRVAVGVTPEKVVVRAGVNPLGTGPRVGEVRFNRGTQAPPAPPNGLPPPTIEGNPQPPQVPSPASPNMVSDAVSALAQADQMDAMSARAAAGLPPVPQPPPPAPMPEVTPESVAHIGDLIEKAPKDQRAMAMIGAHQQLADALLKQGRVVGPDGKLEVIDSDKTASRVAQAWINAEVQRRDDVAEEAQKAAGKEAAKPAPKKAAPVQRPTRATLEKAKGSQFEVVGEEPAGVESGNGAEGNRTLNPDTVAAATPAASNDRLADEESTRGRGRANDEATGPVSEPVAVSGAVPEAPAEPTHEVIREEPAPLQKGDRVSLSDGRPATVEYSSPTMNLVRLKTGDGEKVSVSGAKEIAKLRQPVPVSESVTKPDLRSQFAISSAVPKESTVVLEKSTPATVLPEPLKSGKSAPHYLRMLPSRASVSRFLSTAKEVGHIGGENGGVREATVYFDPERDQLVRIGPEATYSPESPLHEVKPSELGDRFHWAQRKDVAPIAEKFGAVASQKRTTTDVSIPFEGTKPTREFKTVIKQAPEATPGKSEWQQLYEKATALQPANDAALRKMSGEQLRAIAEPKSVEKTEKPAPPEDVDAIKARIAELEAKSAPAKSPTPSERMASVRKADASARLRKVADGMDSQIEDRRRPMTQNPTPKRMAEYRTRIIDADEMERTQKAMRALADAHESGNVPAELAHLRTKDEIGRLVHKGLDSSKGGYYDRIPRQDYYDKTPAGKKLQEMIERSPSPEATAEKAAKEKASKISQLEADVQFQKMPGYFPTPKALAERMVKEADIQPGMSVLEPSAGKGNIADVIKETSPDAKLDVVEQQSKLRQILDLKGHKVVGEDFLQHGGEYDRIIMNPPFEKGADIEHVERAYKLLKPGGKLISIMGPHFEFGSDKKSVAFREWLDSVGGDVEKLADASFKESGTGAASRMVVIDKPSEQPTEPKGIPSASELVTSESGTFEPAKLGEALSPVRDYLQHEIATNKIARNLQSDMYDLEKQYEADVLRAVQATEKVNEELGDKAHGDFEAIYHHQENPNVEKLNARQDKVFDETILPITEDTDNKFSTLEKLLGGDGTRDIENYVHRVVKGKGGWFDRIVSGSKGQGRGNLLSKSAPQSKGRTMMALELETPAEQGSLLDKPGDRVVVSIKGGQVTAWRNGTPENLGAIQHTDEGKVFEDKDGNTWTLTQATTKEIEANTGLEYYHNALASALVSNLQVGKALRGAQFIESFKNSPDFERIAFEDGKGVPPKDWKTTDLPQLRGYHFEPHTAEVLDWYAKKLKNEGPNAFEKIGAFLRTSIFFNPLIHVPNIANHWIVEKGVTGLGAPRRSFRAGVRAINAVIHQNQDFLDALDAGAPLQSQREQTQKLSELFFEQLDEGIKNEEPWAKKVMGALGSLVKAPYKFSGKVTWTTNDIAVLQATYEKMAKGMDLKDALNETSKHIPDYRIPVRILNSTTIGKLMSSPALTMFGNYHYGALKSYAEMAKSAVGQGEPPPGRSKAADAAHGIEMLAWLGVITFVLYPMVDELLKKATGDNNARMRRSGASTFPFNLQLMAKHEKKPSEVLESVATPAVHTKTAIELAANRDLRTGRQIYDPQADWKTQGQQIGRRLAEAVSPVGQGVRMYEQKGAFKRFAYGLAGVSFPKHGAAKIASEIAQSHMPSKAETPKARADYYRRVEILEALRNGDSGPLNKAREAGEITHEDAHKLRQRARLAPLADQVNNFSPEEFMRVYNAATPEEKQELDRIRFRKRRTERERGHRAEAAELSAVQ